MLVDSILFFKTISCIGFLGKPNRIYIVQFF
jgi:hypothetical protein